MKRFAPAIVRIGIVLVLLYFGTQQLMHPKMWITLLPEWSSILHLAPVTLITLNGWLDVTLSILLFLGFYTRIIALIVALHILGIAWTLGYTPIGVRDFGLAVSAFSIFLYGPDGWCLDIIFAKKYSMPPSPQRP